MAEKHSGVAGQYASAADVPKGRPTPTQDELNKINAGEPVELAADGSGPDPNNQPMPDNVVGVKSQQSEQHRAPQHSPVRPPARPVA